MHFGQAAEDGGGFEKDLVGKGRNASDDFTGFNIAVDARLGRADRAIPDFNMVHDADLPSEDDTVADFDATGHAHLGRDRAIFANFAAVGNLHQIINFGVAAHLSCAQGRTIDGGVAAHFYSRREYDMARLGHLDPAFGHGHKPKPLGTNDSPAVNHTVRADFRPLVNDTVGVEHRVIAHLGPGIHHRVGMNRHTIADVSVSPNHGVGRDRHVVPQLSSGMNLGGWRNLRLGTDRLIKAANGLGEGDSRFFNGNPSQAAIAGLGLQLVLQWQN